MSMVSSLLSVQVSLYLAVFVRCLYNLLCLQLEQPFCSEAEGSAARSLDVHSPEATLRLDMSKHSARRDPIQPYSILYD